MLFAALCRRKSLRLQKLSQDGLDTDTKSSLNIADMAGVCAAAAEGEEDVVADEGDDFFSPFPDPDLLSQVENGQAATVAMSTTGKTDFQAARRRHSVMPARRSDPPLLPTTSSESTEAEPQQEHARTEEASTRKPVRRTKPRASARTAPSRTSTRRKTR